MEENQFKTRYGLVKICSVFFYLKQGTKFHLKTGKWYT